MDSEQRRAIARSVAILVAAVVIIGVIVWAIFFRGNDDKKNTGATSPPSSQQSEKRTGSNQKTAQKPGEAKPTETTNSPNGASQNQQQLANVGPGNLLPLFAGATVGGTVLHALTRRYDKSKKLSSKSIY